jgi:hypothetical protein
MYARGRCRARDVLRMTGKDDAGETSHAVDDGPVDREVN